MNRSAGKRRKYEEIAEHLELLIVSGRLHTGDRIPSERELMTQFGAGRSSVREALFVLQRKGLLVAGAGAVPRVRKPTAAFMVAELSGIARLLLTDRTASASFRTPGFYSRSALRGRPRSGSTMPRGT